MRNINILFALFLVLSACQPTAQENEGAPQDLAGKKALLTQKRSELQLLTSEIDALEKEIAKLDPSVVSNKKLVTTLPVSKRNFERFAEIQANVLTDETAGAASEVPGRIVKITVEEGDRVRAGQLIATLDLDQINKQIAEIDKALELADDVFERQERLWKQNIGSELQYLQAKNEVERLRKSKETLDFQLTKSKVYAPISGVVETVNMEAGELAMAGAPIITILSVSKLKVVADLPENFLQTVRRGDQVNIEYPALGLEQSARINLIGSTIDQSNRTFKVEMNTGNLKGQLKPNLLAIVYVKDFEQKDAVVIPIDLVQQEVGGQNYVMITDSKSDALIAKKVYINTGESYDGEVIITSGLAGGETLIEKGSRGLADGEAIEISNEKTALTNG